MACAFPSIESSDGHFSLAFKNAISNTLLEM